jgi:hypothetical protein
MRLPHRFAIAPILCATLVAAGCGATAPDQSQSRDVLAALELGDLTAHFTAPDTVSVGEPFTVQFTTYGGGCQTDWSRVEIAYDSSVASIRRYVRYSNDAVCPAYIAIEPTTVSLRFDRRGTFTVQVIGTNGIAAGGDPPGILVRLEHAVVVR